MKPGLAISKMTGQRYIVTSWNRDGSARTKHPLSREDWESVGLVEVGTKEGGE